MSNEKIFICEFVGNVNRAVGSNKLELKKDCDRLIKSCSISANTKYRLYEGEGSKTCFVAKKLLKEGLTS